MSAIRAALAALIALLIAHGCSIGLPYEPPGETRCTIVAPNEAQCAYVPITTSTTSAP